MAKTKILFIAHEMSPFLELTKIAKITRQLPQAMQEKGFEIRILMPRFGNINERRNRLHEVIRLSGMNIVINDNDNPLIIKVASLPTARMQVYFLDNEEYFQRKQVFRDAKEKFFDDNDERMIFFCKGAIETVKKLNWVPDIIHVHGWMASLLPIYMKHYYKDEALFSETKIVTSVYSQSFEGSLDAEMINKIKFDGVPQDAIQELELPNYENLIKAAIKHSDGVIIASENVSESLTKFIQSSEKPFLPFASKDKFTEAYTNFYKSMLS